MWVIFLRCKHTAYKYEVVIAMSAVKAKDYEISESQEGFYLCEAMKFSCRQRPWTWL